MPSQNKIGGLEPDEISGTDERHVHQLLHASARVSKTIEPRLSETGEVVSGTVSGVNVSNGIATLAVGSADIELKDMTRIS